MRFPAVILTLPLAVCFARMSSVATLPNGIRVEVTTDPGNNAGDPLKAELKPATYNSVYRIFHDQSGLAVYAYELVVERLPDGIHFQITAKPAGEEFAARFPYADGGKPTPTMPIPAESPPLGPEGRFTVEIPTNPGLFEHRTDTVTVQPDPRDRTAEMDQKASPLIRFVDLRVIVGGKQLPVSGLGKDVSGRYAMFYIPKRGGFFFSAQPIPSRPSMPVALVDRARLKFTIDKEDVDCFAAAPILAKSGGDQIWLYHDPHYKPSGTSAKGNPKQAEEYFTAASDTLNWWLR
jgi:hypothetical protein